MTWRSSFIAAVSRPRLAARHGRATCGSRTSGRRRKDGGNCYRAKSHQFKLREAPTPPGLARSLGSPAVEESQDDWLGDARLRSRFARINEVVRQMQRIGQLVRLDGDGLPSPGSD